MRHAVLTAVAGAALAIGTLQAAFAADMLVKAPVKKAPLGASGYLELYTGWDNAKQTFSPFFTDESESNDGWLLGGAGRVNLWINPSFSVQFDAQGEGTQFKVDSNFCSSGEPCNYSTHTYLLAGHATYRDPMLGGIGVFAAAGDMTVPSTDCVSPLSCNGSVRFALGGGEAFVNWNQFTFYAQGGFGGTVGDSISIGGDGVTAPFVRGTVRFYPTSNWLLEGTVLGAWATIKPFDAGDFSDQSTNVLLWRVKAETLVHPNLSVYVAYQGSQTDLSCNGSFCEPGLSAKGTDNRVVGGIRLWLDRDNLRNNDLTGAPLDVINPLGATFVGLPRISDRRLKTDITRVATLPSGLGLYRFKYLWSDTEYVGVMAQEVLGVMPEAVVTGADGFLRVNYQMLGLEMLTYAAWQEHNEILQRTGHDIGAPAQESDMRLP